ncbi:MAG TPA: PEP-CTERM sorting domain-containing protein [Tepidisphaeraceae bacterium]|nr:PEP-CTERM sorting domain-containing protein [Tepidisphaeraceae bacterium]
MRIGLVKQLSFVSALSAMAIVFGVNSNQAKADATFTVNPSAAWIGFMNVSDLPSAGGAYEFGSAWGTADLTATFSGPVLTLGPNSVNDPSSYWYTPSGGPGATGNKIMDANMYVEFDDGSLAGQNITFTGDVLSNTFISGYTTVAFIKDFAPDFSSSVSTTVALTPGVFSISLNTINDPSRHVQYGFETIGPDVWITDRDPVGNAQITGVPEPTSLGLLAVGGLASLRRRRR